MHAHRRTQTKTLARTHRHTHARASERTHKQSCTYIRTYTTSPAHSFFELLTRHPTVASRDSSADIVARETFDPAMCSCVRACARLHSWSYLVANRLYASPLRHWLSSKAKPTKPRSGAYAPKSRLREMAEARPATATRVWKCDHLWTEWKPTGASTDQVGRGPTHAPRPRATPSSDGNTRAT